MNFLNKASEYIARIRETDERLTFTEYLDKVKENPRLTQLAHARLYGMIKKVGIEESEHDSPRRFKFFEEDIFGADEALDSLVNHLHASAKRLETRKRILLLIGPAGAGKSTIVALLKRGLEKFTMTEDGALYAIEDCPMREEPLHAVPLSLRESFKEEFNLHLEGDLCPKCRLKLEEDYDGDFTKFNVVRFVISEANRRGVGVFHPHDPRSMDISDLVGSIDLSTIGEFGSESDPRAYRFDGEANVASRGMLELVELLKAPQEFLYLLLTLSQEQSIKAGRFPLIYADEFLIGSTNEAEYISWLADKKSEAIKDRTIVIQVPYNLRVSDEVKIYEKLINETSVLKTTHIDPQALYVAAFFAILTRLEDPKKQGFDLIKKLKLYNGEEVAGAKDKDVKELKQNTDREGMDGIGPRYIINQLSKAIVNEKKSCLTAIDTLRSIKNGIELSASIPKELKEKYNNFVIEARKDYDDRAKNEVQKAFVYSFEDQANALLDIYLTNAEASVNKDKVRDLITDEEVEPDEKLMRSIEEQINISETASKSFREDVLIRLSSYARKGKEFNFTSHPRLKEAIEKKLFVDLKDIVRITTGTKTPDRDQLEKINQVAKTLIEDHNYCPVCSEELLAYIGQMLGR